ncbi:MAG: LLM class F420-dependent oxidoreductase [Chloroflexaceae bacterium]|jgi:probable F420-dependent oxidoreductase|nr:LLM class F420-dependent oxidoreductase [Chloroflexaceae bacterium]
MQIGAIFPQTEIGNDPNVIKTYAQEVEAMGFTHILAYDHVLGASTASRPDWRGPYTSATPFHEPFVLFGYMAALTQRLELVTGVIILPQRQTALVAKQSAQVDVLSGGRLRLGIGVGWNAVEYEALNEDFSTRGARSEEQIAALRALWSESAITFNGRWHTINDAGINPLPPRPTIPIWIGGHAEAALRRAGTIADGWFPQMPPHDEARAMCQRLRAYAEGAGRNPAAIGIEARLSLSQVPESGWQSHVEGWRNLGASHLGINTMGMGYRSVDEHLAALRRAKVGIEG